jgi:hypothetical protein
VTSDRGVLLFRNILRIAIQSVKQGADPKGIIRDPETARSVRTFAGSVLI